MRALPALRALSVLLALVVALVGVRPAQGADARRAIPPEAAAVLDRALSGLPASITVGDVAIARDTVRLNACRAAEPGACVELTLSDPLGDCSGAVHGPWCVLASPAGGVDDVRAPLLAALGGLSDADVWREIPPDPHLDPAARQASGPRWVPASDDLGPALGRVDAALPRWVVALAAVVVPLALGLLLGLALRRLLRRRVGPGWGLLLAAAPFGLWPVLDPTRVPLGLADEVLLLGTLGLGLAVGGAADLSRRGFARLGLTLGASLLALLLFEGVARVALPRPPAFADPAGQSLFFLPESTGRGFFGDVICRAVYPGHYPELFEARSRPAQGAERVVLHVGDSMAAGYGLRADGDYFGGGEPEAYPVLLNGSEASVVHVNAAIPTAGLDHYLLIVRAWLPRLRVSGVVVHFFLGNDLSDIDAGSICCREETWLVYGADGPRARCPEPQTGLAPLATPRRARGPFLARLLAPWSEAAAHALLAFDRLFGARLPADDAVTRRTHLEAIFAALKADCDRAGVPLALVIVPYRWALEEPDPQASEAWRLRETLLAEGAKLGVAVLDPWMDFEAAVKAGGEEASWYASLVPRDIHFSAKGNRWMADWLAPRLAAALRLRP